MGLFSLAPIRGKNVRKKVIFTGSAPHTLTKSQALLLEGELLKVIKAERIKRVTNFRKIVLKY